jgi:GT2 family glycosyltransferase
LVNNNAEDVNIGAVLSLVEAASSDECVITFVEAGFNGGYGAGNNISILRNRDADYHIVINPDVLVAQDAIQNAIEFMERDPDAGMLTPQVRGFDGEQVFLCKREPALLDMLIRAVPGLSEQSLFAGRTRRYSMMDKDYSEIICPVPYPTGCFMFFRRSVLEIVGLFDEGYFLHYEDADMGRRINQVSQCVYVPSVVVMHKWSRDTHRTWRMRLVTIKSGIRYFRKWGGLA